MNELSSLGILAMRLKDCSEKYVKHLMLLEEHVRISDPTEVLLMTFYHFFIV